MSYTTKVKELFKKYGKVAIGVHLSVYAATLTGASSLSELHACEGSTSALSVDDWCLARQDATLRQEGRSSWRACSSSMACCLVRACVPFADTCLPLRLCHTCGSVLVQSRSLVNLSPPLRTEEELREDAEERGWLAKALTSKGSDLAIAFLCTKALLPVRAPITLALTPAVARCTSPFLLCWQLLLALDCSH